MKLLTRSRMVAVVLAVGLLASCSDKPAPADAAPLLVGDECPDLVDGGAQVRFPDAAGDKLTGVVLGKGSAGVVLSHMSDGDVCGWLPYARQVADAGYRVLVFYFHGFGTSGASTDSTLDGDVVAAAGYLRSQGVGTVALIGASMGAAASLAAATTLRPAPALVISVSSPEVYQGVDALGAVKNLTVPVLYAAGTADTEFAENAQHLYDATPPGTARTLLLLEDGAHGIGLIGAPGSKLRDAMDSSLKQRLPTGG